MKLFSHASTILPVENPLASAEYYRDILGFTISFLWEDPPSYAVINREDAVGIHFTKAEEPIIRSAKLYVFVNDADAVYNEFEQSGANIIEPISNTDYQMREFAIEDLNGYRLVFGKEIES